MATTPLAPTAQQVPPTHDTPCRSFVVPDVCVGHVAPPSLVAIMVPADPTAQHALADGHATPVNAVLIPELLGDQ